jgi:hypothetical protein
MRSLYLTVIVARGAPASASRPGTSAPATSRKMSASSPGFLRLVGCPKKAFLWDSLRESARKPMAKSHLALVAPATVIGTVEPHSRPPKRVHNAEARAREYLTNAEIDRLAASA